MQQIPARLQLAVIEELLGMHQAISSRQEGQNVASIVIPICWAKARLVKLHLVLCRGGRSQWWMR